MPSRNGTDNQVGAAPAGSFTQVDPPAGVCRVCHCTDNDACDGGCSWVEPTLCDTCAQAVFELINTLIVYLDVSGPCGARVGRAELVGELPPVKGAVIDATAAAEFVTLPVRRLFDEVLAQIVKSAKPEDVPLIVSPGSFRV